MKCCDITLRVEDLVLLLLTIWIFQMDLNTNNTQVNL